MPEICAAAIHLCRIRVTRLDRLGNPVAGPNNVYVSDKPISLGVTPVMEEGADTVLTGGCDCIIAQYRGYDKLKRFDLELSLGVLEPALLEMLTGGDAVVDGSGNPIGVWWPSNVSCSAAQTPNVAFEGWQDLWEDDHQHPDLPYVHWIWPSTYWSIGELTLENDFNQPTLNGFSRGNTQWGDGIFGDLPEAAGPLGGFVFSATIPDAECGWRSFAIT